VALKAFEYDTIVGSGKPNPHVCGNEIGNWLTEQSEAGKAYRAVVRLELIERVKWPDWASDINRFYISVVGAKRDFRRIGVCIVGELSWTQMYVKTDYFGIWNPDQARIAENDNGFVKLSEVPNGE